MHLFSVLPLPPLAQRLISSFDPIVETSRVNELDLAKDGVRSSGPNKGNINGFTIAFRRLPRP
jgi:hypothetical protein